MHVRFQRAGHVRDLIRETLQERKADRRRLDLQVDRIFRRRLHVFAAGACRKEAGRDTALRRDGLGRRLLQRGVDAEACALVVDVRRQRIVVITLEAALVTCTVPLTSGAAVVPEIVASAFSLPVSPRS